MYVLKVTCDKKYSIQLCEEDPLAGVDFLFDVAGEYPSHKIQFISSIDKGYECNCELFTYNMGNMKRRHMRDLFRMLTTSYEETDESKRTRMYMKFQKTWIPDIDKDFDDETTYVVQQGDMDVITDNEADAEAEADASSSSSVKTGETTTKSDYYTDYTSTTFSDDSDEESHML